MELATPMIAASENPFGLRAADEGQRDDHRLSEGACERRFFAVDVPKLRSSSPAKYTLKGFDRYRPFHAAEATLPISFELPKDLAAGDYQLSVSDATRYLTDEQQIKPFKFQAQNIDDVFGVVRDLEKVKSNAVYVRLIRQPDGIAMGRTEMPHLPAAMRNVMLGSGRSDTTAFVSSIVKSIPTQLVMDGSADFQLTIDSELRVEGRKQSPEQSRATQAPRRRPRERAGNGCEK